MPELDILKTQIEEVKAQLAEALKAKASVEEKLAKADIAKFETRVTELEGELVTAKAQIEEVTAKMSAEQQKMMDEKKAKEDAQKCKAELEQKLADMAQAQLTSNRINTLVEGGIDKEVASKKVTLYANLTDEQFSDLAADLVEAAAKKKEDKKKEDGAPPAGGGGCGSETPSENETNADASVLENAKPSEEPNLAAGSEQVDDVLELRKELQQALAGRLGIKLEEETKDSE